MATDEQKLSLEQKELVAVGASVGAGCHPCVDHHLKAGANAGLDGERLLAAVTSAERVRAEAAVRMGDHVREQLGPSVTAPAMLTRLEDALAAFGAALGANDATNIERQLRAAADLGASRPQLEQAIATARKVQENAARIHLRKAESLLDTVATPAAAPESETDSGDGCGCGASGDDTATRRTGGPATASTESTAGPFASAGAGETAGIAAAMAGCGRMFAAACAQPAARAETTDEPTATEAAGPSTREV